MKVIINYFPLVFFAFMSFLLFIHTVFIKNFYALVVSLYYLIINIICFIFAYFLFAHKVSYIIIFAYFLLITSGIFILLLVERHQENNEEEEEEDVI
ncbi:MAG: hypothetical protein Ta2D_09870 [Rickettsiales bacterium]|nr:MAG: hypothetical protein Ta2D_09870 [Rickettsiales bacterium]